MLALDTNIVVRFLTRDDPVQSPQAYRLVTSGATFVSDTVLLETEWVMRSLYKRAPGEIVSALRSLVGIDGVTVQNPGRLAEAFDLAASGLDFADALHLANTDGCEAFVTFDKALIRATRGGAMPVRAP